MNRIDLVGKKFGRLSVLEYVGYVNQSSSWLCRCDCGNEKIIAGQSLKKGVTQSCGCLARENTIKNSTIHGEARKTKEYRAWAGIMARCFTPSDHRYHVYGERGITVCDRWRHSYSNFLEDVGRAPSKAHSIDRIDVNRNYEPDNVKWSTDVEQARNRQNTVFVTVGGEKIKLTELAEILGVKYKWLHKQLVSNKKSIFEVINKGHEDISICDIIRSHKIKHSNPVGD